MSAVGIPKEEHLVHYTIEGVARLLRVSRQSLSRWANGSEEPDNYGKKVKRAGVLLTERKDPNLVNFYELIELLHVKDLVWKHKDPNTGESIAALASLNDVRATVENLGPLLGPYPLAMANLGKVGRELVTDQVQPGLLTNTVVMQHLLAFADELRVGIEFDSNGLASRWYPAEDHIVRLDPRHRFGLPSLPSGCTTQTVYDRFVADGRSLEDTVEWFDIDVKEVSAAITFEEGLRSTTAA